MLRSQRKALVWVLFSATLVAGLTVYQSCGTSIDVFKADMPPIGETQRIKATPYSPENGATQPSPNTLIKFILGSKALNYEDEVVIKMFAKQGDSEPLHEFTAKDLAYMHETTECPEDLVVLLNNATLGDGIFCNNTIDLNKIGYVEAHRPNKGVKSATSFSQMFYDSEHQLTGVELVLF